MLLSYDAHVKSLTAKDVKILDLFARTHLRQIESCWLLKEPRKLVYAKMRKEQGRVKMLEHVPKQLRYVRHKIVVTSHIDKMVIHHHVRIRLTLLRLRLCRSCTRRVCRLMKWRCTCWMCGSIRNYFKLR